MRVASRQPDRAFAYEVGLETARPGAEQRLVGHHGRRDPPPLAASASPKADKTFTPARRDHAEWDCDDGDDERDGRQNTDRRASRGARAAVATLEHDRRDGCDDAEDDEEEGESQAVVLRGFEFGSMGCERGKSRQDEDRESGRRSQWHRHGQQTSALGVDQRLDDETGDERADRAAADGEVERRQEHDQADRAGDACVDTAMSAEAHSENDPDDDDHRERIRVSDRFGQLVTRRLEGAADVSRKKSSREPVRRERNGAGDQTAQQSRRRARQGEEQERRGGRRDVENAALGLEHRRAGPGGPQRRECCPARDEREAADEHERTSTRRGGVPDDEHGHADEHEPERGEPPLAREVAAVRGAKAYDGGESGEEGGRCCRPRHADSLGMRPAVRPRRRDGRRADPTCRAARARCSRRSACRRSGSGARSSRP